MDSAERKKKFIQTVRFLVVTILVGGVFNMSIALFGSAIPQLNGWLPFSIVLWFIFVGLSFVRLHRLGRR